VLVCDRLLRRLRQAAVERGGELARRFLVVAVVVARDAIAQQVAAGPVRNRRRRFRFLRGRRRCGPRTRRGRRFRCGLCRLLRRGRNTTCRPSAMPNVSSM
jgi:hypothetical protein